jgi:hypothetical protein
VLSACVCEATGAAGLSTSSHVGFGGVIIAGAIKPIAMRALISTLDALKWGSHVDEAR